MPMGTILVIEPNPDIRENTCELLELDGFIALAADSGVSGLALARERFPDIIIIDIRMPEMDGYAVVRELSKDKRTSAIPVIFLDASPEPKELKLDISGASAYIRKPFSEKDLIDCISNCTRTLKD
jgi:CheY-like chemotaxis protein